MEEAEELERALVISDFHIPFQDDKAVLLMLKFAKSFNPHRVFINGDFLDLFSFSKYTKPLNIDIDFPEEVEIGVGILEALRFACPKSEIIYNFSNHEFRFEKYLADKAPMFWRMKGVTIEEQLELKRFNITPNNNHRKENYYRYGKILIGHWDKYSKHSAYSEKALLEDTGMSLIQAHTHKGGTHYKTLYDGPRIAQGNFCLCSLTPHYKIMPNWQLGIVTIHTQPKTELFSIQGIPIIEHDGDYLLFYGNEIFRGVGEK